MTKTPKLKTIEWDGTVIDKPGMYSKVPLAVYHKQICDGPSVSSSGLRKCFSESPAHFYVEWSGNPNFVEADDKKHFILGRAVHHLMLGEPFFAKLFAVQPLEYPEIMKGATPAQIDDCLNNSFLLGKTRGPMIPWANGAKFCRAWHEAIAAQGRAVLTADAVEQIRGMATALSKHPIVRAGALNGLIERSIFWKDKSSGLWVKARPDAIPASSVDFVDLKKTTSVQWRDLQRTIFDYGYHQQGALVREAARLVLNITQPTFTLIFIEDKPPHCVRVVTLKDDDLDRGERQNHAALDTIARCIKSKHWPGPGGEREDAEPIELPEYAQKQIDDKLEFGV